MKKSTVFFWLAVLAIVLTACSGQGSNEETEEAEEEESMEGLIGLWEGAIEVPNAPLPFLTEFDEEGGRLSIPVQGLSDFPFERVEVNEPDVEFSMNLQGQQITFKGTLEDETISGTFTQQGQSFPFEMKRGAAEEAAEEGEKLEVEVAGGTLTVHLDMPEGGGPFPAAIIIAGSGPTDKDGNSIAIPGRNDSLKMIGENLKDEGIAGIRFDKRGVGENMALGGNEQDLRFDDYIEDVIAIVEAVQQDERFSETSILGHSEGSLVGMAAANRAGADKFVSIAGAGRPIDEVLMEQLTAQLPPPLLEESEEIIEKLKQGEETGNPSPELQSVFRPSVQPYMISWLGYNPAEEIAKLEGPVLVVGGTHDLQVPVEDAQLLHEANPASQLLIVDGMNHVLKEAPANPQENMEAYSDPDLPLADGLREEMIAFLARN